MWKKAGNFLLIQIGSLKEARRELLTLFVLLRFGWRLGMHGGEGEWEKRKSGIMKEMGGR